MSPDPFDALEVSVKQTVEYIRALRSENERLRAENERLRAELQRSQVKSGDLILLDNRQWS